MRAPGYVAQRGHPQDGQALVADKHDCLNLRFPGAKEFQWTLITATGAKKFDITGPFESDDGDVLTNWALDGRGIIMKPVFEVADHLRSAALVPVAEATPPVPIQLTCLSPHRKLKDPKVQLFADFMIAHIKTELANAALSYPDRSSIQTAK